MPISSTANVLTYKLPRPEPKSLMDAEMVELRNKEFEDEGRRVRMLKNDDQWSHGSGSRRGTPHRSGSPYGSPMMGSLNREKHISGRMTAMVAPVGSARLVTTPPKPLRESTPPRTFTNGYSKSASGAGVAEKLTFAERLRRAGAGFLACCSSFFTGCCRLFCFVHNFSSLLMGMLIGALITGLIVGLALWAEIRERDAIIAAMPDNTDCFKDPCPSRSSTCGFTGDNSGIVCNCVGNVTEELGQAGQIDGYNCSFFNNTVTTTLAP